MWKFLYQLASPKYFYQWTGNIIPWLGSLALIALITGLMWGLFFAPADYQQQDAFRIIYIHVPSAFLSLSLYAFMFFLAVLLIVWRIKIAGLILVQTAKMGAWLAALALITGSIWGKPMWGTWWIWDARLTSEFILLILYLVVIATHQAFQNHEKGDKVVAILTMVGVVDLPIIHYSVYWWNTLHQGATITAFSQPKIHSSMLYPLLISLFGLSMFSIWQILSTSRNELLTREKKQHWVRAAVREVTL